jgi:hypothetical protein
MLPHLTIALLCTERMLTHDTPRYTGGTLGITHYLYHRFWTLIMSAHALLEAPSQSDDSHLRILVSVHLQHVE